MRAAPADHPAILVFPPLVAVLGLALAALLQWWRPLPAPEGGWRWLLGGLLTLGFLVAIAAARVMRQAGTTPNPYAATTALVESGPFRFTRNPMYLALLFGYTGLALLLRLTWALLLLPVVALTLHFGMILPEERYLEAKFGAPYREYKARVRRWL